MGKAIAVKMDDWHAQFDLQPPDSGGLCQLQITSQPSSKVKADGKAVWCGPLQFSISSYMDGGTINVPGSGASQNPGTIQPTAQKTKAENKAVILEGDQGQIVVIGQMNTSSGPVTAPPVTVTVKVKSAGQSKVTGA